jgi:ATP-binding cassette subfamily B protein
LVNNQRSEGTDTASLGRGQPCSRAKSQIQQALSLILAEATSIVIAHRLSTVRAADRIIVLREGRIIEQGDHAALLAQGGRYADLYQTYFRHQSLEYVERIRAEAMGDG